MSAFVQRPAPAFTTTAVVGSVFQEISLSDLLGKWYAFMPPVRLSASDDVRARTGSFCSSIQCKLWPGFVVEWSRSILHFRDFTFVCPTEILAFNDALTQFKELNTEVLAVSTDSEYSHFAWANQARKEGGLGPDLRLPLLADRNMKISRDYGVLIEEKGIALRGLFVIDPKGILRSVFQCLPVPMVSYQSRYSGK